MTEPAAADTGLAERSLGDIAASVPGATAVFRRYKLDFCCGGRIALAEAAATKRIALPEIEAELRRLTAAEPPPVPQTVDALIDLVEQRYHAVHRRELPELVRLAKRVEAVHRGHPAVPSGIGDLLEQIAAELEPHMQKEEQVLFPLMRRGGHPMIAGPIAAMLAEHDDHGALLRELETVTDDFTAPDDACATWRALYAGGRKFADDLMLHVHTENNLLFPRFAG